MDADIGIGRETFAEPLYHRYRFQSNSNSYMPLLGSCSPFVDLYAEAFARPAEKELLRKCLEAERNKYKNGYGWNYFYATKEKNNVILWALDSLLYHGNDAQTVACGMAQLLYEDIEKSRKSKASGEELFQFAFAPLSLQYATRASVDKQE